MTGTLLFAAGFAAGALAMFCAILWYCREAEADWKLYERDQSYPPWVNR